MTDINNDMAVKEFIDWALKTGPLDWDKAYSAQCVDLFRFFHNKCVNSSNQPKSVVGAKELLAKNFNAEYQRLGADTTAKLEEKAQKEKTKEALLLLDKQIEEFFRLYHVG